MPRNIREYEITYGTKCLLLELNWNVIAYNPPGSQGTFTIPNPSKDGSFRGQIGSESPDVIAIKHDVVLIVECKPNFSMEDSKKLQRLSKNQEKMEILGTLIHRVCKANDIVVSKELRYAFALAYHGKKHNINELGFISIEVESTFDITNLVAKSSYEHMFLKKLYPASVWESDIRRLFEN